MKCPHTLDQEIILYTFGDRVEKFKDTEETIQLIRDLISQKQLQRLKIKEGEMRGLPGTEKTDEMKCVNLAILQDDGSLKKLGSVVVIDIQTFDKLKDFIIHHQYTEEELLKFDIHVKYIDNDGFELSNAAKYEQYIKTLTSKQTLIIKLKVKDKTLLQTLAKLESLENSIRDLTVQNQF